MKRTSTFLVGIFLLVTVMLAGHARAQTCVEPPAGLVSWWPGDGNANDIQNGNDGTLLNGASFAPGMVGEAFSLDGMDDLVSIGNSANLQLQNFTIDLWVKPDTIEVVGSNVIVAYGSGGYGIGFCQSSGSADCGAGKAGLMFLSKIGFNNVAASSFPDTDWHHLAVTKSGSTVVFYLDGVSFPASPYNPGFFFTSDLGIGRRPDLAGNAFDGLIDEVEIFNRALEASEIEAIFDAGSAGKCKPPLPPTIEELLQRIEDLEAELAEQADHTHTYRTGKGTGHNNTEADTGTAEPPLE